MAAMPPQLFHPSQIRGKRPPLVLPRALQGLVTFGEGWPDMLVMPADSGVLDFACGYWHGTSAANDGGRALAD